MLSRDSTGWRVTGDRRRRRTIISDGREATTSRDAGGRGDGQRGAGGSRGAVREARGGVERARASRGRRERTARVRTRGGALLLADAGDRGDTRRRRATRRNPADWLTPIGALRREARRRERREARDGRHLCERTRLCRVSVAAAVLPIGDDVARTDVPRTICPGSDPSDVRGPLDLRAKGIFGQLDAFAIRMKALLLKLAMGNVTRCDSPDARLFQPRLSFPLFLFVLVRRGGQCAGAFSTLWLARRADAGDRRWVRSR